MHIIRYAREAGAEVGVRDSDGTRPVPVPALADLLALPLGRFREVIERAAAAPPQPGAGAGRPLPPVDGLTEVWASGVTYERSSAARQEESQVADVYARVYAAQRPELFFKSPAWRVCGPGEPIGIRDDSPVNVPEPELALVCNSRAEIVGVTIGNDVSSRSIEGENPLYLPQAKVYTGACALGPGIVPAWDLRDLRALTITAEVRRGSGLAWHARHRPASCTATCRTWSPTCSGTPTSRTARCCRPAPAWFPSSMTWLAPGQARTYATVMRIRDLAA